MKFRLVPSLLSLVLATSGLAANAAFAAPQGPPQGPPPPGYGQPGGGWDTPPQEFREMQRQGFHDGMEGARKDFENHRRPDVDNRDEFRHPNVDRRDRHAYREGFRRGYQTAWGHYGGGGYR